MSIRFAFWLALVAHGVVAEPSFAETLPRQPASQLKAVLDCRSLTDGAARLACYDNAVAAFASAERSGDVVVADKAQIRETKRSLFGLALTPLAIFGGRDHEEMPSEITAKVSGIKDIGYGRLELTLDNGMHWRQSDSTSFSPRVGDVAIVRAASLGSFFLKVANQRVVHAVRVN